MQDNTVYIHGHKCHHNFLMGRKLVWPNWDYWYGGILLHWENRHSTTPIIEQGYQLFPMEGFNPDMEIVYAVHDLNFHTGDEYDLCCEDFGFELPKKEYKPFINMSKDDFRELMPTLDWSQSPWQAVIDKTSWYSELLWPMYDVEWKEWLSLCKQWGSLPVEPYGKIVRSWPENTGVEWVKSDVKWPINLPKWENY